jgi:uncharacterized RDD family membrane protein YckC
VTETPLPDSGWYPDPADQTRQRYWDGSQWTAETRDGAPEFSTPGYPPTSPVTPDYQIQSSGYQPQTSGYQPTPPVYPTAPQAMPAYPTSGITPGYGAYQPNPGFEVPLYANVRGPRTDDGVPLSGWWWRVLATLLDYVVLSLLGVVYGNFLPDYSTGLNRWLQDYLEVASSGSGNFPSFTDPQYGLTGSLLIYALVSLLLAVIYATLMLTFKGATIGMLACQLRVVPTGRGRAQAGLPFGKAVLRCAAYQVLGYIPLLGIINWLFPLWDKKRQTLHDKIAGTQVVRLA